MDAFEKRKEWKWFLDRRAFLLAGAISVVGCGPIIRGQSPETDPIALDDDDPNRTRFIGEIAGVWGTSFSKVESVGLVTQLKGTGSDPPADSLRTRLINEMKIKKVQNPNEILAEDGTSLVIVKGFLPPGIQKGDRYDIEVYVPSRSKTSSLRDGFLLPTQLRRTERVGAGVHQGHATSSGSGPILVDGVFWEGNESVELHGRILGGGVALQSRPIGLYIRDDDRSVSATVRVSAAINRRFDTFQNGSKTGVATPKDNRIIELLVPRSYRLNIGRYLAVIRNLPYSETAASRQILIEQLERELSEPFVAEQAAKKLEALGEVSIPILLRALSIDDAEIRFYAAESLAYMGVSEAAPVLGQIAATEPSFRWHAITALASMEDIQAGSALADLLYHPGIETRYGAFRAMLAHSPNDPTIEGEWLGSSFYLHPIVSTAPPAIHFSRVRRPEIVVFGHDQQVSDRFLYVGQGLTIKGAGPGKLKVTRYDTVHGDRSIDCSSRAADLIRTLAKMEVGYGEMLTVFRAADKDGLLPGTLAVHAVPNPNRRYDRESGDTPDERYMQRDPLPDLFNDPEPQEDSQWKEDSGTLLSEADLELVDGEEKPNMFQRMGDLFKIKKRKD